MAENESFELLKTFPPTDSAFAQHVEQAFAALGERAGPERLQARLRDRYPTVRVQVQERLGMNGAVRPHWYVFRDGRITRAR